MARVIRPNRGLGRAPVAAPERIHVFVAQDEMIEREGERRRERIGRGARAGFDDGRRRRPVRRWRRGPDDRGGRPVEALEGAEIRRSFSRPRRLERVNQGARGDCAEARGRVDPESGAEIVRGSGARCDRNRRDGDRHTQRRRDPLPTVASHAPSSPRSNAVSYAIFCRRGRPAPDFRRRPAVNVTPRLRSGRRQDRSPSSCGTASSVRCRACAPPATSARDNG